MKRNAYIIAIFIIVIIICIVAFFTMKNRRNTIDDSQKIDTNDASDLYSKSENPNNIEEINMNEIIIKVNGKILNVKLEENTSARAFAEKLRGEI